MTKTFHDDMFGYSNFGYWDLFDIWNFIKSLNTHQGKSTLGITKVWPFPAIRGLRWARIFTDP